jgi:hypothetical protein
MACIARTGSMLPVTASEHFFYVCLSWIAISFARTGSVLPASEHFLMYACPGLQSLLPAPEACCLPPNIFLCMLVLDCDLFCEYSLLQSSALPHVFTAIASACVHSSLPHTRLIHDGLIFSIFFHIFLTARLYLALVAVTNAR